MILETPSLFDQIGPAKISEVIRIFYDRAFEDPMIQHFFLQSDKARLVQEQTDFVTALLGGPRSYNGKPLLKAHEPLKIRKPHFGRRQVIMAEVLASAGVADEFAKKWLALEQALQPLILAVGTANCQLPDHLSGKVI